MARDAKSLQRSAYAFVAVMLIMGLGTFGYYTWTGTVVHPDGPEYQPYQSYTQTPTTKAKYIPAAALTVEERVKGAPQAVLRLTNNAPIKLTLPDTAAIEPLYAISIKYSAGKDAAPVELPRRSQAAPPPRVNFDSNRDAAVELIYGNSFSRVILLSHLFDMQKPGHYELTVKYQPVNLDPTPNTTLPEFNVNGLSATTAFDLPFPVEKKE